jgi:hypothetical protein
MTPSVASQYGFREVPTGGGCTALIREQAGFVVTVTSVDEPSAPKIEEEARVTIDSESGSVSFLLMPGSLMHFLESFSV